MEYWIELLGYAASLIILVSLTMKSIVKLRIINAVGSALFVVFAVLTRSTPTVVMNIGIICIDLYYVWVVRGLRTGYNLVAAEKEAAFLDFFYQTHQTELDSIFGERPLAEADGLSWYIADNEIAGLFAWQALPGGVCRILVDFVTPRYRDTKIGAHFFGEQLSRFAAQGFTALVYRGVGQEHWKYLRKIGFEPESGAGCAAGDFRKNISS